MNDEENRTSNQEEAQSACETECDSLSASLPCENPHARDERSTERDGLDPDGGLGNDSCDKDREQQLERDRDTDLGSAEILDDSLQDADPSPASDPADADPPNPTEQLEQLRNELKALRAEIAARNERLAKLGAEYAEFQTLYPNTSLDALDESVMADVRRGIPVAAAYALSERRRIRAEEQAALSNAENSRRTAGAIHATDEDYYSPDEVRKMSRSEVRENYPKILASMKKWH